MIHRLLDRYLPPRFQHLLVDEYTIHDNPIGRREELRESRRRSRPWILFLCGAVLASAIPLACGIMWLFAPERRHAFSTGRVPTWMGGSWFYLIFALVSSLHALFVIQAASRRAMFFFLEEYRSNTLHSLLSTAIHPFQMVIMATRHPFREGMFVAFIGLPFYLFIWACGGIAWWELAGLYGLFALMSTRPARWSIPVFSGIPADVAGRFVRMNPRGANGSWMWAIFGQMFGFGPILSFAFGNRWIQNLLGALRDELPDSVIRILPSFVITWPLILVRFLLTPLAWYGLSLPPILVIFPLFLCARLQSAWESSIYLRSGDADMEANLPDLPNYWRLRRAYGLVMLCALIGFFWKPYVSSGMTAALITTGNHRGAMPIAGLFWFIGAYAAFVCWARVREVTVSRAVQLEEGRNYAAWWSVRPSWRGLIWYCAAPVVGLYVWFFAVSTLLGDYPFHPEVFRIVISMLTLTLLGALAYLKVPTYVVGLGLAINVLPLFALAIPIPKAGTWIVGLSPFAAIMSISEHANRIASQIPYVEQSFPTFRECAVGLIFLTVAGAIYRKFVATPAVKPESLLAFTATGTMIEKYANARGEAGKKALAIQKAERLAKRDAKRAAKKDPEAMGSKYKYQSFVKPIVEKNDTRLGLKLIAWFQRRWDDANMVRQLRVLLRGRLADKDLLVMAVAAVAIPLLAIYRIDISTGILLPMVTTLYGDGAKSGWAIGAGLALLMSIASLFISMTASVALTAAIFPKEKDKSTLGFMLMTPLRNRQIVLGKLAGTLAPTLMAHLSQWTYGLILTLPLFGMVTFTNVLVPLFVTLTLPIFGILMGGGIGIGTSMLVRKETDAQGLGILIWFAMIIATITLISWIQLGVHLFLPMPWGLFLFWVPFAVISILCCLMGIAFAEWRLKQARSKDIAFESTTAQTS